MTECTFFDDEQPTHGLPQWATITQVSEFLAIPRNAVSSAVRRALANQEDWVKKESGEGGNTHYLINTTHEIYQSHAQRWKQNQVTREEEFDAFFSSMSTETASPPSDPYSPAFLQYPWRKYDPLSGDVLQHWTKFRQRLHTWGIQIFQNILAEEDEENSWQWRWGMLHGEGYPNKEEAIIAAIESRIMDGEDLYEETSSGTASLFPQSPPPAPGKAQHFTFFHKKNDFPPF